MSAAAGATVTYLIDGYNLLHRAIGFQRGADLHAQRRRLDVLIGEFQRARPDAHVVVVYDGAREAGGPGEGDRGGARRRFEVLYSRPPASADDLILEEWRRRRRRGPVIVVTSDLKDIARVVTREGGEHCSSEEFAELIEDAIESGPTAPAGAAAGAAARAGEGAPEKPAGLTDEEAEEWMRIFAPGDGAEEGEQR